MALSELLPEVIEPIDSSFPDGHSGILMGGLFCWPSAQVCTVPRFTECWLEKPPWRPSPRAIGLRYKSKLEKVRIALRPREYEKFCIYHRRVEKLDDILPQLLEKGSLHLKRLIALVASEEICKAYKRWIGPLKLTEVISNLEPMLKEGGVPLHNQGDLEVYRNVTRYGHVDAVSIGQFLRKKASQQPPSPEEINSFHAAYKKASQDWRRESSKVQSTLKRYDPEAKKRYNQYSPLMRIPQFQQFLEETCKILSNTYSDSDKHHYKQGRRQEIQRAVSVIANRSLVPQNVLAYLKRIRSPLHRFISPKDLSGIW